MTGSRSCRSLYRDPVSVVSTDSDFQWWEGAKRGGLRRHISKPYSPAIFMSSGRRARGSTPAFNRDFGFSLTIGRLVKRPAAFYQLTKSVDTLLLAEKAFRVSSSSQK